MARKVIRVLVVDDSFFMRKLLRELISDIKGMTVVGDAKDGTQAIGLALTLEPDVITMDYNMPNMKGDEVIRKILENTKGKKPGIIMLSAYADKGGEQTLSCLRAGAVDTIKKPSGELSLNISELTDEIVSKIKIASIAAIKVYPLISIKEISYKKNTEYKVPKGLIIIGSSTGGPPIVQDLLSKIPSNFPYAVVVVQHMSPYFTSSISNRLDKLYPIKIKEAENGESLQSGVAYFAPGGHQMTFKKENGRIIIKILEEMGENDVSPSIDITMISAAQIFKNKIMAIELTGMGRDGTKGLEAIKKVNGHTIAQDPKTAVIASMPKNAINAKVIDEIVEPKHIPQKIMSYISKNT